MIKIPLNKNKMLTRSRSLNFQSWVWILGQTFITYRLCRNPDAARAHGNRDNFSKMYANSTMNNGSVMKFGEQGMAQCWEHSPSTNVGRVQILASKPYVGWVCCWFSPLLREVFLRILRFSPPKNQLFQIPIRPGIRLTKNQQLDMLPLNRYLLFNS